MRPAPEEYALLQSEDIQESATSSFEYRPTTTRKKSGFSDVLKTLWSSDSPLSLYLALGICVLCTLINLTNVLQQSSSRVNSFSSGGIDSEEGDLEFPSTYMGLSDTAAPDAIPKFDNFPLEIVQAKTGSDSSFDEANPRPVPRPHAANPNLDTESRLTRIGGVWSDARHFVLSDLVSSIATFRVTDFGYENCSVAISFEAPSPQTAHEDSHAHAHHPRDDLDPARSSERILPASPISIDIWMLQGERPGIGSEKAGRNVNHRARRDENVNLRGKPVKGSSEITKKGEFSPLPQSLLVRRASEIPIQPHIPTLSQLAEHREIRPMRRGELQNQRRELLQTIEVQDGSRVETQAHFNCPSGSFLSFEFVCSEETKRKGLCKVAFWQNPKAPELGVRLVQNLSNRAKVN